LPNYLFCVLSANAHDLLRLYSTVENSISSVSQHPQIHSHIQLVDRLRIWVRIPHTSVITYYCLHGTAPRKLQDVIQPVAEVTSRRRLRSASSSALVVPATRRLSLGDQAFAVAGPRAWNSLPQFVTDCSSPLKTYLLSLSF